MQLPSLDFSKVTLDNGLDVILRRQQSLPLVAVNLWYHVGSKNEERNQRGFAHLFEHLMFEGSEHYPRRFLQASSASGCEHQRLDLERSHQLLRGHSRRRIWRLVLAMESDRMANLLPAIDESKLKIQKGVVKNEYRQNYANRPYGMVWPILAEATLSAPASLQLADHRCHGGSRVGFAG